PAAVTLAAQPDWGWPFWTGGIVFGWLSAEQTRRFRALVAELTATRERLAEQAVHLERRRIAAELHDLVGHSLGVLLLHVTGARRRVRDDPDAAEEALRQAEGIGKAGLTEIRRSVAALRDEAGTALAPTLTAADVPELVKRTAAAGSTVRLTVTGELDAVEAIIGLAVYRVVQESLANATRHASGAPAQVRVAVRPDVVEVVVTDAGSASRPSGAAGAGGVGLVGMRERVEALGGTLDAGPTPTGWRVQARIPRAGTAAGGPADGPVAQSAGSPTGQAR
ncbi:MAG TPA: histidine kinase, partial [Mycobacteriales bacterium]|nr:histidine kinase [Mycobacteriales bacterium]